MPSASGGPPGPGANRRPAAPPGATRWPAAPPGADCDVSIVPVVSGHLDPDLLDDLIGQLRAAPRPDREREQRADRALRDLVLGRALDLLSGPAGLAAWLRTTRLDGVAASASLPLDIGTATETIPAHLRRAVIARDRHCRFPGCTEPPAACQAHHVIPRSQDGPTSLRNLVLLCTFHHLIAVHRWGWVLSLHTDGEVAATSPDHSRVHHSCQPGRSSRPEHRPHQRRPRDPATL